MIYMTWVFNLMMLSYASLLLGFLLTFILHFLMPRNILKIYFKEPYFSSTEIIFSTGLPYCFMRTVMFLRLLGFPSSGKFGGIEKAHEMAPVWFCKIAKFSIFFVLASGGSVILASGLTGIYMMLN